MCGVQGSPIREPVTHTLIKVLWDDLSHPPIAFTGPQYRSIDGYGTSLTDPSLGKAGTRASEFVHLQAFAFPALQRGQAFASSVLRSTNLGAGFLPIA